ATIGTLTQKMKRQPKPSTRAPPRIGPSPSAKPDTEPNTPMALARSARAGNVVATIDIVTGLSIVPPPASFAASTSHPTQVSTPRQDRRTGRRRRPGHARALVRAGGAEDTVLRWP